MPLKDVDVKTFDAYKKAIRSDVSRITASGKTKFWVYKDVEIPDLKGKKQKIVAFTVLVDDAGVRTFLKGKKLVCAGTCKLEEGKVAFEPIKGKVPYNQLKTAIPLFLGKLLYIPPTASPEDEADEEIEQDEDEREEPQAATAKPASTPPAPPPQGPNLTSGWNALVKEMQAAVAAAPTRKEVLQALSAGIPDLINANKVQEATARMEAVRRSLAAPPPPQAPPAEGMALTAKWNKLGRETQAAIAANPARKDALSKAASGIPELVKAGNVAEAKKRLDALEALLAEPQAPREDTAAAMTRWNELLKQMRAEVAARPERQAEIAKAGAGIPDLIKAGKLQEAAKAMVAAEQVLKTKPPQASESEAGEEDGAEDAADRQAFQKRYAAAEKPALELLKKRVGDLGRMRALMSVASERAGARDYAAAMNALSQLEDLIDKAEESPETEPKPYPGLVKYRSALVEFANAKSAVFGHIEAFRRGVIATLPDEAAFAEEVAARLEELNDELSAVVNDAMNDAEDVASPVTDKIRSELKKYIDHVHTDGLIKRVDKSPFASVSIENTLGNALLKIQAAMPEMAAAQA